MGIGDHVIEARSYDPELAPNNIDLSRALLHGISKHVIILPINGLFSWQHRVLHGFLAIVATLSTKFYHEYTFTH